MPEIKPLKGVVYNREIVKDICRVLAPPYDVIPPKMQDALYKRHPHNIVRLILNRTKKTDTESDNRYTRAGAFFDSWIKKNIVLEDAKTAIYAYSQSYKYAGRNIERTGFIALMKLGSGGKVLPHENTLAAPKADRLSLMRCVNAILEPIFVIYDDKAHEVVKALRNFLRKKRPFINVNSDGVLHRVWRIDDEEILRKINAAMSGKDIFIADGHHRYETARNFHAEAGSSDLPDSVKAKSGYTMAYFVEADERTLTVLPTHRVVRDAGRIDKKQAIEKLKAFFTIRKMRGLRRTMRALKRFSAGHGFGMYLGGREFYILKLKDVRSSDEAMKDKAPEWRRLDVSILHLFVFRKVLNIRDDDDNIEFFKDPEDAARYVGRRQGEIAFFLNPTRVPQIKRIAALGEKMPRKATYFYPKPLSGLVMYKF